MTSRDIAVPPVTIEAYNTSRHRRLFLIALAATDALTVVLAFIAAYILRFYFGVTVRPEVAPALAQYARLVIVLAPFWLLLFYFFRLYDYKLLLGGVNEYSRVFNACTTGMMFVVLYTFADEQLSISRAWVLLSWLLTFTVVVASRVAMRRVAYSLRKRGLFVARAIIIGANQEAQALAKQLSDTRYSGLQLVGFLKGATTHPAGAAADSPPTLPIIGEVEQAVEIIRQRDIEEVIVATTALHRDQLLTIFEQLTPLDGVQVRLSSGLYEIVTTGVQVQPLASVPLMSLNTMRLEPLELALKTFLDYTLIIGLSVFWLPLFALFALAIKLDSPGPIIYRRRVLGVGGKQFDAFKFRTMFTNGDEILAQHPELLEELRTTHKLKNDPRITRVGALLRKTSLDELPQLFNVLAGQMSLVGPRMIHPTEVKEYGRFHLNLLTVKPGLTGLWQVSGRSDLSYAERVQLDMHYIRNYSIWLDMQILFFQTIPAVIQRRGAY